VLAEKGYHYQFVFARNAGHCDRATKLQTLPEALEWVRQGVATGASDRNWKGYGHEVTLPADSAEWKRRLVTDPQTSGGLLVSCAEAAVPQVLDEFKRRGFAEAAVVGKTYAGTPHLKVT